MCVQYLKVTVFCVCIWKKLKYQFVYKLFTFLVYMFSNRADKLSIYSYIIVYPKGFQYIYNKALTFMFLSVMFFPTRIIKNVVPKSFQINKKL